MEVLVGPTLGIDVSSPAAYVRDRDAAQDKVTSCLFLKEDGDGDGETRNKFGSGYETGGSDNSSESSSSIGAPGDSEVEDDDDVSFKGGGDGEEVQSKFNGGLATLGSLEDSLPIKRGLSSHFSGKSKSFASLSDVSLVKDLEKPENPFNKRRRVLIACKLTRRSSFYSWQNPKSMPLLALNEDDEDDPSQAKNGQGLDQDTQPEITPKFPQRKLRTHPFMSQSCFSLSDLQEQD